MYEDEWDGVYSLAYVSLSFGLQVASQVIINYYYSFSLSIPIPTPTSKPLYYSLLIIHYSLSLSLSLSFDAVLFLLFPILIPTNPSPIIPIIPIMMRNPDAAVSVSVSSPAIQELQVICFTNRCCSFQFSTLLTVVVSTYR
jgi:hypothetical protein